VLRWHLRNTLKEPSAPLYYDEVRNNDPRSNKGLAADYLRDTLAENDRERLEGAAG
jgi:hypothetical protein